MPQNTMTCSLKCPRSVGYGKSSEGKGLYQQMGFFLTVLNINSFSKKHADCRRPLAVTTRPRLSWGHMSILSFPRPELAPPDPQKGFDLAAEAVRGPTVRRV